MTANFPKIDFLEYFIESEKTPWTSNKSCKGSITLYTNLKAIPLHFSSENIVEQIALQIDEYLKSESTETLKNVFFLIQAWGGNSARRHAQPLLWNWLTNVSFYKQAVAQILTGNYDQGLEILIDKIDGMGMSFASKHLHFWTGRGNPILDSIISTELYNTKDVSKITYSNYLEEMTKKANEVATELESPIFSGNPVRNLEAAIFCFALKERDKKAICNRAKTIVKQKEYFNLIPTEFNGVKSHYIKDLLKTIGRREVLLRLRTEGIPVRYSELREAK